MIGNISDLFDPLDIDPAFTSGERRDNLIRSLLQSDRWADYSQNEARNLFREAGFRFRDSTFNTIFNEVVGGAKLPVFLSRLGLNTTPSEHHFFEAQYTLPTRYRYTIKYTFENSETGEIYTEYRSLNTNTLEPIIDTLNAGAAYIGHSGEMGSLDELQGIQITRGFIDRSK